MKALPKTYFPGLNGLRFIAASMVIFHHVEQYKFWADLPSAWGNPVIDSLGHQAVSFFFVLSGFLITYLLMVEHQKTGKISLGRFYWRRILRIWPLYFLIVVLALAVAPFANYLGFEISADISLTVVLSLVLLLPNILRIVHPTLLGANQLWSVGIEEQFYAIWPILIRKFIHNVVPFLLVFLFVKLLLHWWLMFGVAMMSAPWLAKVERLYALFPVEQMAVGGLGAAFLFYGYDHLIRLVLNKWVLFIAFILLIISSVSGVSHFILKSYLDAGLFIVLLINVVKRPELHTPLEKSVFLHLGNISYGIYMWHTLVITCILGVVNVFQIPVNVWSNTLIHLFSFMFSVGIAHVSYKWFETPFLKMKDKFAYDASSVKKKWVSQ